ncbi:MAG TPA: fused response regulator/phosphatase, partial [Pirellulaceae bacterium]|nr:fused response regulator/phosphatase [Pirellulaceae bacterium]
MEKSIIPAATSTILIVDDERIGRKSLESVLLNQGFRLEFASSGEEALRRAKELTPDLILLDVMMPDMDGIEVTKRLRADVELADIPVVLVTAFDELETKLAGIEAGADDFIAKPFDRAEVRARVRGFARLNRYRRLHEALRMRQALAVAADVQKFLLPSSPPPVDGFDIAGVAKYSDEIGGDSFDFIPLPDGRIALTVGDAAGHGVSAALLMAALQALVRREAVEVGDRPDELLSRVNRHLTSLLRSTTFITFAYVLCDPVSGRVVYASAGHEPLQWQRTSRGENRCLLATGIPLGIDAGAEYGVGETLSLETGDLLVVCTDGVTETNLPGTGLFGRERLGKLLSAAATLSADEICRRVVKEVDEFRGPAPQ